MQFKDIINNRRAVNFFNQDKNVSEEDLKDILEMAANTPSSFNLQPWSVIVLRDKEEKIRLQKHAMNQAKVSEAPVTLIFLADRDGWKEDNETGEKVFQEMIKAGLMKEEQRNWFKNARANLYGGNKETELAFAVKNTGFFAMSVMLAAKSKGIDTHPMDGFDMNKVKEEFKIPDNYWVPLLMSIGYFDENKKLMPPKWRKSYNELTSISW